MHHTTGAFSSLLLACTGLLHLIAFSKSFCDWYTDHLYPYWAEFFGRLTAKVPFVIGEILIALAALLLLAGVIFLILLPFLRRKQGYRTAASRDLRLLPDAG